MDLNYKNTKTYSTYPKCKNRQQQNEYYNSNYKYNKYNYKQGNQFINKSNENKKQNNHKKQKDDDQHQQFKKGDILLNKQIIQSILGDGTFSKVCEATSIDDGKNYAIKIIRSIERQIKHAKIEANILKFLNDQPSFLKQSIIRFYESFSYKNFQALVFEKTGSSLQEFLKGNYQRGYPMQFIKSIAQQLLSTLNYLHSFFDNITHTDLKPENILLYDSSQNIYNFDQPPKQQPEKKLISHPNIPYKVPLQSVIKLIDFGGATYKTEHHSSIINTRQYRAPEVILNLTWNEKSDIWSLGCILIELYTGDLLFETHNDNNEHLALMEKILERFLPSDMIGDYNQKDNKEKSQIQYPNNNTTTKSIDRVKNALTLKDLIPDKFIDFQNFVDKMLVFDPNKRPRAKDLLSDIFLNK